MKYGLIALLACIFILIWIGALLVTRVRFSDQRPRISSLYCRLQQSGGALSKPVIFIPGTKGSLLAENGVTRWITLENALRSTPPFSYDPQSPPVQAIGIFTRISLLPGLIEYAPYQTISAYLACQPHAYVFAYDWRQNPFAQLSDLDALVARITKETGEKPSIIAHSMGGLVTHAYLKNNSQKIDRVVYVGVPFGPGLSFLQDMDKGVATGLNKTLLSKEALFSHPGSFTLLPRAGYHFYKGDDLMIAETWKKHHLSVFRDGEADLAALQKQLDAAADFRRKLETPVPLANKFLFIVGNCQRTLKEIFVDDSQKLVAGDGRVPEDAAFPVEMPNITSEVIRSCATHDTQLSEPENLKAIVRFLQ